MKHKQVLRAICLTLLVALPLPADEKDSDREYEPWARLKINGSDIKEEFDAEELRSLAAKPSPSQSELDTVRLLVPHAAVKKDASFHDLLEKPELRKWKPLDLTLSAYDYPINQSEAAFDHILAQLATEEIGSDSDLIVALMVLDEWGRTLRAFRKHFVHTDGAGGTFTTGFKATRAAGACHPCETRRLHFHELSAGAVLALGCNRAARCRLAGGDPRWQYVHAGDRVTLRTPFVRDQWRVDIDVDRLKGQRGPIRREVACDTSIQWAWL